MAIIVRIHPLHANGSQRVEVGGRLDTHTYGELDDRLALVLASKPHSLLLDLAQLEYVSSAGVRSIFRARKLLAEQGGKLVIANAQPQVQKVFDIVKKLKPSARGELEITDVNNAYIDLGEMTADKINGFWADAGENIDFYLKSCNMVAQAGGANKDSK